LEDGVIEPHEAEEFTSITAVTWQRVKKKSARLSRCLSQEKQKSDARECAAPASWRVVFSGETNA
jgi:hypothetical protein